VETKHLSRREIITRAGYALGGAATLATLQSCSSSAQAAQAAAPGPQVADFPYEQHLAANYQLDPAPVKEAAYHGYYAGGCCHGAYSALVGHLASTVGAPFNLLPLDFGKFGGGGIANYGSICGAILAGNLVINMIAANATARAAMMTDLMRWYERTAFPSYTPTTVDAGETGLTKDFSAGNLVNLQVVPGSHLCHASVSGWCTVNGVTASGADKKARCARLTADVASKVAQILNAYLAASPHAYTAASPDAATAACAGCHTGTATGNGTNGLPPPSASGMSCTPCHGDKATAHP
jgi:hypothetical protein